MRSDARTVDEYLASLPDERRAALSTIRETILRHLPEGYDESMQYGMIGYSVPLSRCPNTYNGQPLVYAALASQKHYISVYLMGIYGSEAATAWFRDEYRKTGKKLDMGKSCLRFKKLEDVPLELIGQAIAREPVDQFIRYYAERRA